MSGSPSSVSSRRLLDKHALHAPAFFSLEAPPNSKGSRSATRSDDDKEIQNDLFLYYIKLLPECARDFIFTSVSKNTHHIVDDMIESTLTNLALLKYVNSQVDQEKQQQTKDVDEEEGQDKYNVSFWFRMLEEDRIFDGTTDDNKNEKKSLFANEQERQRAYTALTLARNYFDDSATGVCYMGPLESADSGSGDRLLCEALFRSGITALEKNRIFSSSKKTRHAPVHFSSSDEEEDDPIRANVVDGETVEQQFEKQKRQIERYNKRQEERRIRRAERKERNAGKSEQEQEKDSYDDDEENPEYHFLSMTSLLTKQVLERLQGLRPLKYLKQTPEQQQHRLGFDLSPNITNIHGKEKDFDIVLQESNQLLRKAELRLKLEKLRRMNCKLRDSNFILKKLKDDALAKQQEGYDEDKKRYLTEQDAATLAALPLPPSGMTIQEIEDWHMYEKHLCGGGENGGFQNVAWNDTENPNHNVPFPNPHQQFINNANAAAAAAYGINNPAGSDPSKEQKAKKREATTAHLLQFFHDVKAANARRLNVQFEFLTQLFSRTIDDPKPTDSMAPFLVAFVDSADIDADDDVNLIFPNKIGFVKKHNSVRDLSHEVKTSYRYYIRPGCELEESENDLLKKVENNNNNLEDSVASCVAPHSIFGEVLHPSDRELRHQISDSLSSTIRDSLYRLSQIVKKAGTAESPFKNKLFFSPGDNANNKPNSTSFFSQEHDSAIFMNQIVTDTIKMFKLAMMTKSKTIRFDMLIKKIIKSYFPTQQQSAKNNNNNNNNTCAGGSTRAAGGGCQIFAPVDEENSTKTTSSETTNNTNNNQDMRYFNSTWTIVPLAKPSNSTNNNAKTNNDTNTTTTSNTTNPEMKLIAELPNVSPADCWVLLHFIFSTLRVIVKRFRACKKMGLDQLEDERTNVIDGVESTEPESMREFKLMVRDNLGGGRYRNTASNRARKQGFMAEDELGGFNHKGKKQKSPLDDGGPEVPKDVPEDEDEADAVRVIEQLYDNSYADQLRPPGAEEVKMRLFVRSVTDVYDALVQYEHRCLPVEYVINKVRFFFLEGQKLLGVGVPGRACDYFSQAIDMCPSILSSTILSEALLCRAQCYKNMGAIVLAIRDCSSALESHRPVSLLAKKLHCLRARCIFEFAQSDYFTNFITKKMQSKNACEKTPSSIKNSLILSSALELLSLNDDSENQFVLDEIASPILTTCTNSEEKVELYLQQSWSDSSSSSTQIALLEKLIEKFASNIKIVSSSDEENNKKSSPHPFISICRILTCFEENNTNSTKNYTTQFILNYLLEDKFGFNPNQQNKSKSDKEGESSASSSSFNIPSTRTTTTTTATKEIETIFIADADYDDIEALLEESANANFFPKTESDNTPNNNANEENTTLSPQDSKNGTISQNKGTNNNSISKKSNAASKPSTNVAADSRRQTFLTGASFKVEPSSMQIDKKTNNIISSSSPIIQQWIEQQQQNAELNINIDENASSPKIKNHVNDKTVHAALSYEQMIRIAANAEKDIQEKGADYFEVKKVFSPEAFIYETNNNNTQQNEDDVMLISFWQEQQNRILAKQQKKNQKKDGSGKTNNQSLPVAGVNLVAPAAKDNANNKNKKNVTETKQAPVSTSNNNNNDKNHQSNNNKQQTNSPSINNNNNEDTSTTMTSNNEKNAKKIANDKNNNKKAKDDGDQKENQKQPEVLPQQQKQHQQPKISKPSNGNDDDDDSVEPAKTKLKQAEKIIDPKILAMRQNKHKQELLQREKDEKNQRVSVETLERKEFEAIAIRERQFHSQIASQQQKDRAEVDNVQNQARIKIFADQRREAAQLESVFFEFKKKMFMSNSWAKPEQQTPLTKTTTTTTTTMIAVVTVPDSTDVGATTEQLTPAQLKNKLRREGKRINKKLGFPSEDGAATASGSVKNSTTTTTTTSAAVAIAARKPEVKLSEKIPKIGTLVGKIDDAETDNMPKTGALSRREKTRMHQIERELVRRETVPREELDTPPVSTTSATTTLPSSPTTLQRKNNDKNIKHENKNQNTPAVGTADPAIVASRPIANKEELSELKIELQLRRQLQKLQDRQNQPTSATATNTTEQHQQQQTGNNNSNNKMQKNDGKNKKLDQQHQQSGENANIASVADDGTKLRPSRSERRNFKILHRNDLNDHDLEKMAAHDESRQTAAAVSATATAIPVVVAATNSKNANNNKNANNPNKEKDAKNDNKKKNANTNKKEEQHQKYHDIATVSSSHTTIPAVSTTLTTSSTILPSEGQFVPKPKSRQNPTVILDEDETYVAQVQSNNNKDSRTSRRPTGKNATISVAPISSTSFSVSSGNPHNNNNSNSNNGKNRISSSLPLSSSNGVPSPSHNNNNNNAAANTTFNFNSSATPFIPGGGGSAIPPHHQQQPIPVSPPVSYNIQLLPSAMNIGGTGISAAPSTHHHHHHHHHQILQPVPHHMMQHHHHHDIIYLSSPPAHHHHHHHHVDPNQHPPFILQTPLTTTTTTTTVEAPLLNFETTAKAVAKTQKKANNAAAAAGSKKGHSNQQQHFGGGDDEDTSASIEQRLNLRFLNDDDDDRSNNNKEDDSTANQWNRFHSHQNNTVFAKAAGFAFGNESNNNNNSATSGAGNNNAGSFTVTSTNPNTGNQQQQQQQEQKQGQTFLFGGGGLF